MTDEERIRVGQEAAQLFARPAFTQAVAWAREDIMQLWARTPPDAAAQREQLHHELQALDRVVQRLKAAVGSGEAALVRQHHIGAR